MSEDGGCDGLGDGRRAVCGLLDAAAHAVRRQARQSALALALAALGLALLAPLAVLGKAGVALARQRGLPLGEVPWLMAIIVLSIAASEELLLGIMKSGLRLWRLRSIVAVQSFAWVAAVATAQRLGAKGELAELGLATGFAVHVLARPVAMCLRCNQSCDARTRRTVRELKASVPRVTAIIPAFIVICYLYVTVFTHLMPLTEVVVMGLAMPLLQAACMTLVAYMMLHVEKGVKRRSRPRVAVAEAGSPVSGLQARTDSRPRRGTTTLVLTKETETALSLITVLTTETYYSTGAFATLALAESDQSFFAAIVFMLLIQVAYVAFYVKARRVVSHVTGKNTAEALFGDNQSILQWLLHQELGEKLGVLLAIGTLAIDQALGGRHGPPMPHVDANRLVWRGAAMLLAELVGDIGKDMVSQRMGVLSSGDSVQRVSLPPKGVGVAITQCLAAALTVTTGLALGAPSAS